MEKTNITFKLDNDTSVSVMRNGKRIGRIWSQRGDGTTPYPHDKSEYCMNSVQFCGFDRISEVWGCGPFQGKKDCVLNFVNWDNEYHKNKENRYKSYVKNFINSNKHLSQLQSFDDWSRHNI